MLKTKLNLRNTIAIAICLAAMTIFVSCEENPSNDVDTSQVGNVTFTECNESNRNNNVVVEFGANGVYITHYGLEVNCAFDTVFVTQTFENGILTITEKGNNENMARCLCSTDVSYTISGISQSDVNVIYINGEQVYCHNEQPENLLVGKWLHVSGRTEGDCDTIVFTEDFYVKQYLDYIFANQVIPAMYLPPFVTYSLSGNDITFTIHYTYPDVTSFSETFNYVLNGNSLIIRGFSNPFSVTEELRTDVHFTRIEENSILQGTKWKLEGIVDTQTGILTELEPNDCDECYSFTFNTDSTATGRSTSNELGVKLKPVVRIFLMTYALGTDFYLEDAILFCNAIDTIISYELSGNYLKFYYNNGENYLKFKKIGG